MTILNCEVDRGLALVYRLSRENLNVKTNLFRIRRIRFRDNRRGNCSQNHDLH